jgi:hypothetical protein
VKAIVALWHPKLGDLKGDLLKRFELLQPFTSDEITAVEKSPGASWAYCYKVIESTRAKKVAMRGEKVRLKDGEIVSATEKEFRRLVYLCPSTAIERIMEEAMVKRGQLGFLDDMKKEQMFAPLRDAITAAEEDDKALEQASRERGVRNLAKLRELAHEAAERLK